MMKIRRFLTPERIHPETDFLNVLYGHDAATNMLKKHVVSETASIALQIISILLLLYTFLFLI